MQRTIAHRLWVWGTAIAVIGALVGLHSGCSQQTDATSKGSAGIIGGIPDDSVHPSTVMITAYSGGLLRSESQFSGVIVGPNLVATVAHGLMGKSEDAVTVTMGSASAPESYKGEHSRAVHRIYIHPGYINGESVHDLALLVTSGLAFPSLNIARIERLDRALYDTYSCGFEFVGYGIPSAANIEVRRAAHVCLVPEDFTSAEIYRSVNHDRKLADFDGNVRRLKIFYDWMRTYMLRKHSFVPAVNAYYPLVPHASKLPSGLACDGDSGGGVYSSTGALIGLNTTTDKSRGACTDAPEPGAVLTAFMTILEVGRYTQWIAHALSNHATPDLDPDCIAEYDHHCARRGVPNVPSCGFLAAQGFGWKLLHTVPASELPTNPLPSGFELPPLTESTVDYLALWSLNEVIASDQQLRNWHALHGWRLHCDQTTGSVFANDPSWARLDGYQSDASFPGSSPAAAGGTWDCAGCYLWRGDASQAP